MPRIRKSKNNGLTLVEILVVIVIMAMLMGLILPAISAAFFSGQKKATQVEINSMEIALGLYEEDFRDYPPSTIAELGIKTDNQVNSGNEAWVLCLSSQSKTQSYYKFQDEKLANSDKDISPIPLVKVTGSYFKTSDLLEINDHWGTPYIYFHSRDLTKKTQQKYTIAGQNVTVSPHKGESKTGQFHGYGRYQIISVGPDMTIGTKDDLISK